MRFDPATNAVAFATHETETSIFFPNRDFCLDNWDDCPDEKETISKFTNRRNDEQQKKMKVLEEKEKIKSRVIGMVESYWLLQKWRKAHFSKV